LDLPQPLGPTTPTSWPGSIKVVGSANDLKPDNLIELRRTGHGRFRLYERGIRAEAQPTQEGAMITRLNLALPNTLALRDLLNKHFGTRMNAQRIVKPRD
jgi:hypothetical protein